MRCASVSWGVMFLLLAMGCSGTGETMGGVGGPPMWDKWLVVVVGTHDNRLMPFQSSGDPLAEDVAWPKYTHEHRE